MKILTIHQVVRHFHLDQRGFQYCVGAIAREQRQRNTTSAHTSLLHSFVLLKSSTCLGPVAGHKSKHSINNAMLAKKVTTSLHLEESTYPRITESSQICYQYSEIEVEFQISPNRLYNLHDNRKTFPIKVLHDKYQCQIN